MNRKTVAMAHIVFLSVALDEHEKEWLRRRAAHNGTTMSDYVRTMIQEERNTEQLGAANIDEWLRSGSTAQVED